MKNIARFTAIIFTLSVLGLSFAEAAVPKVAEEQGTIQTTVDADGVTQMVIYESDFNRLFLDAVAGSLSGYIKSATVKIFDGYVEVTAVATRPITATLFVRASITAKDGKLYPKFLKMYYGFLPIPAFLMNFFVGKLAGQDFRNFQSTGVQIPGVDWQSVVFGKGKATVRFKESRPS